MDDLSSIQLAAGSSRGRGAPRIRPISSQTHLVGARTSPALRVVGLLRRSSTVGETELRSSLGVRENATVHALEQRTAYPGNRLCRRRDARVDRRLSAAISRAPRQLEPDFSRRVSSLRFGPAAPRSTSLPICSSAPRSPDPSERTSIYGSRSPRMKQAHRNHLRTEARARSAG